MSADVPRITQQVQFDAICVQFEQALREGEKPDLSAMLTGFTDSEQSLLLTQLLLVELEYLQQAGAAPNLDDYVTRFPQHESAVRRAFQEHYEPAANPGENEGGVGGSPRSSQHDDTIHHAPIAERPGSHIGKYKLLEQIGEGGMGVVYMAQQEQPVRRRVALKIIKPGMDSKQVVARFEAERQALAMMDHPNIAKVLDGGVTETGRPYFVMDLVKGVPITQYCDDHRLRAQERLALFACVCRAVQHAHQKGIIHRDLKPSNVLVAEYDHQPVPKIIDFGVAKATGQDLTEKTLFTHFGQIVGTLDYMSPEQAKFNQLDIDTRSDIYSLGVLLFELLTGSTPIENRRMRSSGLEEILRMIREEEPPRPSTRLSSSASLPALAESRSTDPRKLAGQLREDLDWIVIKALAKERNERYQTAEALADDVENHLNDRPIAAHRPSFVGRTRRFVRRHKLPVALSTLAAVVTAVAISLGIVAHLRESQLGSALSDLQSTQSDLDTTRSLAEKQAKAREFTLPRIKELIEERRPVAAFQMASGVQDLLAGDPAFNELWEQATISVSISTEPSGATVAYREARDSSAEWTVIGPAPINDRVLPRGDLRFRFSKEGYATLEFQRPFPNFLKYQPIRLRKSQFQPDDMVFVQGGRPSGQHAQDVKAFFIDRHEVTNQEYLRFVEAGGYENSAYWSELEFVRDGMPISWDEAMQFFVDATGMSHGPALWRSGEYPDREDLHPVRGVSWYEAAAFAKFSGKTLPSLHHWRQASKSNQEAILTALSNYESDGPRPVGVYDGVTHFGVYDMAGNVKEWCFNEIVDATRTLMGGAYDESDYMIHHNDFASPWDRNERHGFRCAKYLQQSPPDPAVFAQLPPIAPRTAGRKQLPREEFMRWLNYDRELPLNANPIKSYEDDPHPDVRHEVVQIDAAYNGEHFNLHIYVPQANQDEDRLEAIVWMPGAGNWAGSKSFDERSDWRYPYELLRSNRIVCQPIYQGSFERHDGVNLMTKVNQYPVQAREAVVEIAKDVFRTVDYLTTRPDVDVDHIVFIGQSIGAVIGAKLLAAEPRLSAGVLLGGGYGAKETNAVTSHIMQPMLMINGAHDHIFPYAEAQKPMFDDLGSEVKEHVVLNANHNPDPRDVFEVVDSWLRKLPRTGQLAR